MSENEFQNLMEVSWRRPLTSQEERTLKNFLTAHPAARVIWEEDLALNRMVARLPDAPVSTNFTAQVLQAVARETAREVRQKPGIISWLKRNWIPRIAIAGLFICAGLVSVQEYRAVKRAQLARDVAAVSSAATFPQGWLEDFDAINRLSQPPVDNELLAALE